MGIWFFKKDKGTGSHDLVLAELVWLPLLIALLGLVVLLIVLSRL